jgi:hypothetical protein
VKAGPLVCAAETNFVNAGTVSVIDTFCASDGPALLTVIV